MTADYFPLNLKKSHQSRLAPEVIEPDFALSRKYREAKQRLSDENIALVAHYYTHSSLQQLALDTGGFVGDSLEMARFGAEHHANTLVVAGVRFMAESAKILSPEKRIHLLASEATCSLDISTPPEDFRVWREAHPDRTAVVYANTSAEVKAIADWVVTSSIACDIVDELDARGEKLLFAPDRHLGNYIQRRTGADMLIWDGYCIVHDEFQGAGIDSLKRVHPDAAVLAHPECSTQVLERADTIGSTSALFNAVTTRREKTFIIATDRAMIYSMQRAAPDKVLIPAPTQGAGASCRSCAHCPWMALNSIDQFIEGDVIGEVIELSDDIIERASVSMGRMIEFSQRFQAHPKSHAG